VGKKKTDEDDTQNTQGIEEEPRLKKEGQNNNMQ
jgi:hypothetical protein